MGVLPFCCLFRFVCDIPHFSHVPPAELPPSSTFLFSHNFFECGWISAILRCGRPSPDAAASAAPFKGGQSLDSPNGNGVWLAGNRQSCVRNCFLILHRFTIVFVFILFAKRQASHASSIGRQLLFSQDLCFFLCFVYFFIFIFLSNLHSLQVNK